MATRFCDVAAAGANNGTSWEDAYTSLVTAIAASSSSDQVWVKEGTYQEGATVQLKSGVLVYGGFDSALTNTSGSVVGRNLVSDISNIDGQTARQCVAASVTATFDGFHVIHGRAAYGAGLYHDWNNLTMRNVIFDDCVATGYGGGAFINGGAANTVEYCTATACGAVVGGGFCFFGGTYSSLHHITATNCTCTQSGAGINFGTGLSVSVVDYLTATGCAATGGGGGLSNDYRSLVLTNAILSGNSATTTGANLLTCGASTYRSCVIAGGSAGSYGAGVYVDQGAAGVLYFNNCVIADNTAVQTLGSAICTLSADSDIRVTNCIVWGNSNSATQFYDPTKLTITYSDIQGGFTGTGNINADPKFVAAGDNPYALQSISPCIDAGNGDVAPATDYLGNARVDDLDVANTGTGTTAYTDIGAYEYQWVAPPSSAMCGLIWCGF